VTWVGLYLIIGLANAIQFQVKERRAYGPLPEGNWHEFRRYDVVDFVLFTLFWPVQLAYFLVMHFLNLFIKDPEDITQ
jgi:hypothetical protein